ncbi:E3 ubiquitin-protein ligase FANCL isoform X3 [Sphaeramia orbicularis]|uniref:E3 ubiquitin-protein ligase FANCL isoform X3 n=1 Tax=Sphaeramia orbicularis TaxID=375764 RepID=UPI00117F43A7|nr:E3 ubiquitin-protein ligase FANCL isoform X3 [Sphaeramia orbicularis]
MSPLLFIDTEFQTLRLKAEDSSGRQHILTVKLKPKHPAEAPECSADLPLPLDFTWTPQSTLDQLHSQFLLVLESLSDFWNILDEIDSQTWILEPEKPSRSDTTRRIAIGNNVSIKVEVDPRHPKMLPECCLLGAEHVVTPLRNKLNANMHMWNPDSSVLHNLRDVLEIEFPSPATHEKSSFSVECGICYSYRLEAAIPDQVCNDPRCGQPFHQACLYEWLRALPSSRQSFNIVFGECPYCSKVRHADSILHKGPSLQPALSARLYTSPPSASATIRRFQPFVFTDVTLHHSHTSCIVPFAHSKSDPSSAEHRSSKI